MNSFLNFLQIITTFPLSAKDDISGSNYVFLQYKLLASGWNDFLSYLIV